MAAPKLFISYSWSSVDHEQEVIRLATDLAENGVNVIFDKWDLKEGHDKLKFMEKMVTDPEIKKVAMIIDETYATKADGREGGVGTETQIISKEVYENQEQGKFVAVIMQKDEKGKPYLPTYYKSRMYIDLNEPGTYGQNFEQLLRWIFDKPLYAKPEVGKPPSFLEGDNTVSLGTSASYRRAFNALITNAANTKGALNEYFGIFAQNLEKFRIEGGDDDFDDRVVASIESFLPYRNEAVQLFAMISQYASSDENIRVLHRFLESLLPYTVKPERITSYSNWDCDNFYFIVHELFLYAVAVLIQSEHFDDANYLLENGYYLPTNADRGLDGMVRFSSYQKHMESLNRRIERLQLPSVSLRADMLRSRCSGTIIRFEHLMQADFVVLVRAMIEGQEDTRWWPETLLYATRMNGPFEIFARAVSKKYFDRIKCLLAIETPDDLDNLLGDAGARRIEWPHWGTNFLFPAVLLNCERLAKRP